MCLVAVAVAERGEGKCVVGLLPLRNARPLTVGEGEAEAETGAEIVAAVLAGSIADEAAEVVVATAGRSETIRTGGEEGLPMSASPFGTSSALLFPVGGATTVACPFWVVDEDGTGVGAVCSAGVTLIVNSGDVQEPWTTF